MLTRKLGWSWGLFGCHIRFWHAQLSKNRNFHNFGTCSVSSRFAFSAARRWLWYAFVKSRRQLGWNLVSFAKRSTPFTLRYKLLFPNANAWGSIRCQAVGRVNLIGFSFLPDHPGSFRSILSQKMHPGPKRTVSDCFFLRGDRRSVAWDVEGWFLCSVRRWRDIVKYW